MIVKIKFETRQEEIPCRSVVILHTIGGDVRAEYLSGSESPSYSENPPHWCYSFLVQNEDMPAGFSFDELNECNIIAPYWSPYCFQEIPVDTQALIDEINELKDIVNNLTPCP